MCVREDVWVVGCEWISAQKKQHTYISNYDVHPYEKDFSMPILSSLLWIFFFSFFLHFFSVFCFSSSLLLLLLLPLFSLSTSSFLMSHYISLLSVFFFCSCCLFCQVSLIIIEWVFVVVLVAVVCLCVCMDLRLFASCHVSNIILYIIQRERERDRCKIDCESSRSVSCVCMLCCGGRMCWIGWTKYKFVRMNSDALAGYRAMSMWNNIFSTRISAIYTYIDIIIENYNESLICLAFFVLFFIKIISFCFIWMDWEWNGTEACVTQNATMEREREFCIVSLNYCGWWTGFSFVETHLLSRWNTIIHHWRSTIE